MLPESEIRGVLTSCISARALDRSWGNQPKGHRRWLGSRCFDLQIPQSAPTPLEKIRYSDLFSPNDVVKSQEMSLNSLALFFYYSFACTGRKDTYQSA